MTKETRERFWSKVSVGRRCDCWIWMGAKHPTGYGNFGIGGNTHKAHRVAWELAVGSAPAGMCVLHLCDNPSCVNPAHLFLGTHADNMRDMAAKGRASRGKDHGERKATRELALNIRAQYSGKRGDIRRIAEKVNLSEAHVGRIVRNQCWKEPTQ